MDRERNPFHWRGTVTDREAFVGREREMVSIFARLQTLSCVSVVGERRIGKSSLAYSACLRAPKQLGSECRAAFMDLLSSRNHTLDGLLQGIMEGLGEREWEPGGPSAAQKLASFEEAIRGMRKSGRMPVVFLDEFEGIASRVEQFGDDLLESWRSLGNDGQIGFVATSARSLEEVTKQSDLTSSFYNIFAQMQLREFAEQEAREFTRRATRVGGLEVGDEAFMLRVGGQHPLRLQVAAWHLFAARQAGEIDFGRLSDEAEAEIAGMMQS